MSCRNIHPTVPAAGTSNTVLHVLVHAVHYRCVTLTGDHVMNITGKLTQRREEETSGSRSVGRAGTVV